MNSVVALTDGASSSGMPEPIKNALVSGVTTAGDYVIVVIPVAMSIFAIKFGIRVILNLFHSLTNA